MSEVNKKVTPISTDKAPATVAAVGVSVNVKMGPRVETVVQTHFAQDSDFEKSIDDIFKVVDKHKARYEIEEIEAALAKHNFDLDASKIEHDITTNDLKEQFNKSGRKGDFQFNGAQLAQQTRFERNIKRGDIETQRLEAEIEKRKAIVAGENLEGAQKSTKR